MGVYSPRLVGMLLALAAGLFVAAAVGVGLFYFGAAGSLGEWIALGILMLWADGVAFVRFAGDRRWFDFR